LCCSAEWVVCCESVTMNGLCELGVLLLMCVTKGLAIHCYECNSQYDRWCDSFPPPSEGVSNRGGVGSIDCDVKLAGKHLDSYNSTICRKIIHKVADHYRVVRSCGWIDDKKVMAGRDCMRKTGTYDVQMWYCSCYEDLCNSAPGHQMSLLLLVGAALGCFLYKQV